MGKEKDGKTAGRKSRKLDLQTVIALAVGLGAIVFLAFFFSILSGEDMKTVSEMQDQLFDVTVGEEHYGEVDLDELRFTPVDKGTQISYSAPLKGNMDQPILRIYLIHSVVHVYMDGEEIFTHGDLNGHLLGYGYVMVPLPEDYEGRELKVVQTVWESGEMGNIRNPVIFDGSRYYKAQLSAVRLTFFTDAAMIMLSLAVIFVGFVFLRKIKEAGNLMWMAAAFIGMGLWEFCNSNMVLLFAENDLVLKAYMEYLSLYITPHFLLMYFADDFCRRQKRRERIPFIVIQSIQLLFIAVALILHFTDTVHLPGVLYFGHFVILLTLAYILTMNIRQVFRRKTAHREILIGTLILAVVGLSDIVRYLFFKLLLKNNTDYISFILLGMFAFALCMILDFFNTQQRNVLAEARSDMLEKMAYRDMMTGLYNRQMVRDITSRIAEDRSGGCFGIVNFDLNDLKKTNDIYGHTAGDKLIMDFSALLKEVFGEKATVARIGGDEFVVIYRDMAEVDHEECMNELERRCELLNREREQPLSYAMGFCSLTKEEAEAFPALLPRERIELFRKVYKLADARMYENKAEIKKARA
ncbi:MAG: diguanylate cyclase [Lachnospiraceae bacterium]|nr:diguanylate cyclase [Lachnospiraceae bacterium]